MVFFRSRAVANVGPLFEIEGLNGAVVVRFLRSAHVESRSNEPLAGLLSALKSSKPKAVVVDLSRLEWANSLFLGILVGLNKELQNQERKLIVACVSEQVQDILRLTGVHRLLSIHKTLADALAEVDKQREVDK